MPFDVALQSPLEAVLEEEAFGFLTPSGGAQKDQEEAILRSARARTSEGEEPEPTDEAQIATPHYSAWHCAWADSQDLYCRRNRTRGF